MTGTTAAYLTAMCCGVASSVPFFQQASPAQEWTVLGLLAVVVVGIGTRMVMSLDKNTTATNQLVAAQQSVAFETGKLTVELRALLVDVQHIPDRVADRLRKD